LYPTVLHYVRHTKCNEAKNDDTTMMVSVFTTVWSLLTYLLSTILNLMMFLTILYTFCSYMGWIRRLLWFLVESKLSEIFNGADVTVGSLDVNIVEGRMTATNAVLHTPHQKEWNWEAPLIARVGRVYVEWNMWGVGYQLWWLGIDPPVTDIYTIHMRDIQVFVERKQHVFNLYLVDPTIVLPNPADIVKQTTPRSNDSAAQQKVPTPTAQNSEGLKNDDRDTDEECDAQAEQQAQELVNQLFSAVKSIGKKGAWRAQKETLTSKLRELQSLTKKTEYMQEGAKVITKVGKAVAKTSNMPTVPERRNRDEPPFYCRVGRVILRDVRVFTRQGMQWNKPIVLKEIVIRAAELCPPMSSLDEKGHPAIYQPIEKLVEVVWKRVLTEMAKSQTGRLLNTAMGEFLGIAITSMENNSATTTNSVQPSTVTTVLEYRPGDG
jgi:hypothetical protein